MNGCGPTRLKRWIAGVLHHTKNPMLCWQKTKRSIIIYAGYFCLNHIWNYSKQSQIGLCKVGACMGYLKGQFSSLWRLHQQIDNAIDHKCALAWVKTCIVIHTLIVIVKSEDEDGDFIAELVQEGTDTPHDCIGEADVGQSDTQRETQGQRKCSKLKDMLIESIYNWQVLRDGLHNKNILCWKVEIHHICSNVTRSGRVYFGMRDGSWIVVVGEALALIAEKGETWHATARSWQLFKRMWHLRRQRGTGKVFSCQFCKSYLKTKNLNLLIFCGLSWHYGSVEGLCVYLQTALPIYFILFWFANHCII